MGLSKSNIWVYIPKFSKFARSLSNLNLPQSIKMLITTNMYNVSQIFKIQLEMTTIKVINTLENIKKKQKKMKKKIYFF